MSRQKPTPQPKAKAKAKADNGKRDRECSTTTAHNDPQRLSKKAKKRNSHDTGAKTAMMPAAGGDDVAASIIRLTLHRPEQLLAGIYWLLLTREIPRSAVVAIPNAYTLTPQQLAGIFRHLGFQSLALHNKMTAEQRKQSVDRLRASSPGDKMVIVTTAHFLSIATSPEADLMILGGSQQSNFLSKFARIFAVSSDKTEIPSTALEYQRTPPAPALLQLQARIKLATQMVEAAHRLGQSVEHDAEDKWANKFAKGADLGDDDEDVGLTKKAKKKDVNPDEQRFRALSEKLLVALAKRVEGISAVEPTAALTGSILSVANGADDNQNRAEKLRLLGMVAISALVAGDERLSAQTQWLDGADGARFGGQWVGHIRHGASKDATSLRVREAFCSCKGQPANPLSEWRPNEQPADREAWGGAFGKPCGHNEVVMHDLRPFYPQEVLNSRVCSKRQPAPGNQGFDGCLEFLRLACLGDHRAMTIWDCEHFIYFGVGGSVTFTKKIQLLNVPLAGLQCLMKNLRAWTVASEGRHHPMAMLGSIRLLCRLGNGDVASAVLGEPKLQKRILTFAVGGSTRVWKQLARMPYPLETESVYAGK